MKNPLTTSLFKGTVLNSPSRLEKLARSTGWVKRSPKKIQPIDFVHGIMHSICVGTFSFRALATSIGMRLDLVTVSENSEAVFDTVSKQAIWKRTNQSAVDFMNATLGELLKEKKVAKHHLPKLDGVDRILAGDSTKIGLPPELAEDYPAGKGPKGEAAGLRLQGMIDLISGEAIRLELTNYYHQDAVAGMEIIPLVRPKDLILQDLGYWNYDQFNQIDEIGAYFLSRYKHKSVVHHVDDEGNAGKKLDLLKFLVKRAPNSGDKVDINIVLGVNPSTQINCRLVAVRVPDKVAQKRAQKINAEAKRRGKTPSKLVKKLSKWAIYVTNLPEESADTETVLEIYPLRWRIETVFKALKSYTPVEAISEHRSNPEHLQILLYGWLCLAAVATQTGAFALARPSNRGGMMKPNLLSLLKVLPKVFEMFRVALFHSCSSDPGDLIWRWMAQCEYHDRYEKRKKRVNMAEMAAIALGYDEVGFGAPTSFLG